MTVIVISNVYVLVAKTLAMIKLKAMKKTNLRRHKFKTKMKNSLSKILEDKAKEMEEAGQLST